MTETVDTIAEIERIVLASGQWAGIDEVEFSVDGDEWSTVFAPTTDHAVPAFARATVHRLGAIPTRVTISWAESLPVDDEWRGQWERRPMALFGARAIRSAYRRAFRDLVDIAPNPAEGDGESASRDWSAEFAAAATVDDLEALVTAAKKQRAVTTALDREWRARREALRAADPDLDEAIAALEQHYTVTRPTPAVMGKRKR